MAEETFRAKFWLVQLSGIETGNFHWNAPRQHMVYLSQCPYWAYQGAITGGRRGPFGGVVRPNEAACLLTS